MTGREVVVLTLLLGWNALAGRLAWRNYDRLPSIAVHAREGDVGHAAAPDLRSQGSDMATAVAGDHAAPASHTPGSREQRVEHHATSSAPLPVSVIVPARNEAARLPALLASLARQMRSAQEMIVVDDQSEDATARIAEEMGATVLASGEPPSGWTGKTYACRRGADVAHGTWLLFLDADVTLQPAAIAALASYAEQQGLDGVSIYLQQRCESFWERLLLPFGYATYFVGARPSAPRANGQCILISAAAYRRCGGHAAIRGSVIDDVALARRCRQAGVTLRMARGEALGAVRMYTGLSSIWQGFSKNAFRFVTADPAGGALTVAASIGATTLPQLVWRAWRLGGAARWLAAALAYAIGVRGMLHWQRLFRAGTLSAALHPLAAIVFAAIAQNSMLRALTRRGVRWKGRTIR